MNQVWATDITYIPMKTGLVYLMAFIDWYSRRALTWRLSNSPDLSFCVEVLEDALARFHPSEIFNGIRARNARSTLSRSRFATERSGSP
jgi:putative transposase